jgi:acyl dehydratase
VTATFTDEWRSGRITEVGLEEMRAQIGIKEPVTPWISTVSEDAIWHFALGVGDDNPLWWDRQYAEKTRAGRMFAPPTLLYTVSSEVRKPGDEAKPSGVEVWLPGVLGLWAGDRWNWYSRVWADERISATRELHDVRERSGKFAGRSIAQTELVTFTGEDGRPVADLYRTILRFERESSRHNSKYLETPEARYTADERQAIIDQYAGEAARRRGGEQRYWEDVRVGDEIPGLVKGPLSVTNIVGWLLGWGSPQCPTNRMLYQWLDQHPGGLLHNPLTGTDDTLEAAHWDSYFAQESGMARGYDFGSQRISWAGHVFTDWCGDDGELVGLDARLQAPDYLGDTTWFTGRVTDKQVCDRGALARCEVAGTNQRGQQTIVATATVALPTRSS